MHRLAIFLIIILTCNSCEKKQEVNDLQSAEEKIVHEFRGIESILLQGRQRVDVMQLMAPREHQNLTTKIQNAAASDPQWWQDHVKKAEPGQPLPYDPKLGVTDEEFRQFLELSKKLTMQKQAEAELIITKTSDGKFLFDGGAGVPKLTGIQVDIQADAVTTPYGIATNRTEIDAPEDSALGKWRGVQWSFEQVDGNLGNGTAVKLSVGTHRSSGRGIIYYDVKHVPLDSEQEIFYHVIMFDISSAQILP